MSDTNTKKSKQPIREGSQQVRDATHAAIDAGARSSREALGRTEDVLNRTANGAHDAAASVADTVARTTDAAVDITQRVAEQGNEVIRLGMRAAAGVNTRFADANYGRGHQVVESTARAMNIYREAGESTAENVRALVSSWTHLGRGVQQMQHAYLELLDRTMQNANRRPQDLLRAKSTEEFASVQRDLYLEWSTTRWRQAPPCCRSPAG
ncbi:MAG: hypothetical protein M3Y41_19840 [Pseudomonadota bacterium]|nr:hypothetical protein [Pseudomonadota bacterium]